MNSCEKTLLWPGPSTPVVNRFGLGCGYMIIISNGPKHWYVAFLSDNTSLHSSGTMSSGWGSSIAADISITELIFISTIISDDDCNLPTKSTPEPFICVAFTV